MKRSRLTERRLRWAASDRQVWWARTLSWPPMRTVLHSFPRTWRKSVLPTLRLRIGVEHSFNQNKMQIARQLLSTTHYLSICRNWVSETFFWGYRWNHSSGICYSDSLSVQCFSPLSPSFPANGSEYGKWLWQLSNTLVRVRPACSISKIDFNELWYRLFSANGAIISTAFSIWLVSMALSSASLAKRKDSSKSLDFLNIFNRQIRKKSKKLKAL